MPQGKVTSCPWCGTVHLWADTTHGRFCTDDCKENYDAADQSVLNFQSMEGRNLMLEEMNRKAAEREAARRARLRPVEVFCNKCVTTATFVPTVDGSNCAQCGYPLSFYEPFDPKPSMWVSSSHLVFGDRTAYLPRYVWSASLPCVKPFPA